MRVVEPRGDLDFGQEPFRAEYGRELGTEDLDRYLALVSEVRAR
jgi:hypothetical protein